MVGEIIKSLRKTHNMTQDQVANLANCNREKLSRYENNMISRPDYFFICRLADIFSVDADYFRKEKDHGE